MFSRRHYQKIADTLRGAFKVDAPNKSAEEITLDLVSMFKADNPNFNAARFTDVVFANERELEKKEENHENF